MVRLQLHLPTITTTTSIKGTAEFITATIFSTTTTTATATSLAAIRSNTQVTSTNQQLPTTKKQQQLDHASWKTPAP
jgi:ATP-dependent helicase/DNAse subunit B